MADENGKRCKRYEHSRPAVPATPGADGRLERSHYGKKRLHTEHRTSTIESE